MVSYIWFTIGNIDLTFAQIGEFLLFVFDDYWEYEGFFPSDQRMLKVDLSNGIQVLVNTDGCPAMMRWSGYPRWAMSKAMPMAATTFGYPTCGNSGLSHKECGLIDLGLAKISLLTGQTKLADPPNFQDCHAWIPDFTLSNQKKEFLKYLAIGSVCKCV